MKKGKFIIVRHPPLRSADDDAVNEFERLLKEGFQERRKRKRLDPQEVAEQLWKTLLRRVVLKVESLITPEAVAKIHGIDVGTTSERRELAERIRDEISKFIYGELVVMSGLPHRGRKRGFAARDAQIYQMRGEGRSYGQIANALKIRRNAVQAAYRRERQRRELVCENYPKIKEALKFIGILLQEQKPQTAQRRS